MLRAYRRARGRQRINRTARLLDAQYLQLVNCHQTLMSRKLNLFLQSHERDSPANPRARLGASRWIHGSGLRAACRDGITPSHTHLPLLLFGDVNVIAVCAEHAIRDLFVRSFAASPRAKELNRIAGRLSPPDR